jgi:zinc protease
VAWDTRVRREARASVFANVLERRMFRELRQEGGLSYQVQTAYEVRCGDTAVVTAVADALPEKRQAVLGGMIDILAAMRAGTIDPEDVTAVVNQGCDALSEAEEQGARLPGQAFNLLAGRPVQNIDEVLAGLRAVTADDVAEVGAAAYAAGLLVTPAGTVADWAGYAPAPDASESAVAGTAYPALRGTGRRLVAGADGVSVVGPDGPVTVRYDACAAVLSWPDGGRQVIGLDGLRVAVEPTLYPGAAAVARDLDTRLPAGLRVPMPERDPDQIPQPPPPPPGPVGRSVAWLRRVRGGLRRSEPRTWISLLGGLAATAVGAALTVWLVVQVVVGEQPDGLPSVLVVGGATAYGCLRTRRILRTLAGSR